MKKIFLVLAFLTLGAYGDVPNHDFGILFNRLPGEPLARKYQLGTKLREMHNTAICVYDYATSGGAVGNINLLSTDLVTPCKIPGKAVIRGGFIDVTTAPTSSSSATIAFSSGKTASDLHGAIGYALYANQLLVSPVFATVSTYIKLPNANSIVNGVTVNAYQPIITIGTAALTAGHIRLFIDYEMSE